MRTLVVLLFASTAVANIPKDNLSKIADKILKETKHNKNIDTSLIIAFAKVESSFDANASGDGGKAYGLYQFHKDRWLECGGTEKNWKNADVEIQTKIMITALNKYCKSNKKEVDYIRWMATSHNIGHGIDKETDYVKKVRKANKK